MSYRRLNMPTPATSATTATNRPVCSGSSGCSSPGTFPAAPNVADVADVAAPALSADEQRKQASIRVRLLFPDLAAELLTFWRDDIDDIRRLPDEALQALAADYQHHRAYYLNTLGS